MPLYYDTSTPTQGATNSITRSATDFGLRDFLLHKNIQNPIRYPQLQTAYNGAPKGGEPVLDTVQGTNSVIQQVSIEVDGIFRYDNAIVMNTFKNTEGTAGQLQSINTIQQTPIFPTPASGTINYAQEDLSKFGILAKSNFKSYRKLSTLKNLYVDAPKQIDMAEIISLQPIQDGQQMSSYADEYGALNVGNNSAIQTANVIGSVLNGQGLGFAKGGVVTNYDIRASLAGRALTATGLMKDTKLGVIGGQQLALSLANNAAFNVEQQLFGKLNVSDNILSLVKGKGLVGLRPDYTITTPSSTGAQILTYAEKVLGFNVPRSYLQDSGSIFFTENKEAGNIERANSMLQNTGNGQIKSLQDQFNANLNGISNFDIPANTVFRSGYAPGFTDHNGKPLLNPNIYAFSSTNGTVNKLLGSTDGIIPDITYKREQQVDSSGFSDVTFNYELHRVAPFPNNFTWTSAEGGNTNSTPLASPYVGAKKSLLTKTQALFNSKGMKTIVSTNGDANGIIKTQIQTAIQKGAISKGSAVMGASNFTVDGRINSTSGDTPDNIFCRTWTPFNRYDTVRKLIRSRGLNQAENTDGQKILESPWRENYENGSVLDDNGIVKIAPYKTDNLTRQADFPKKYMFSIENLAWVGNPAVNLPAVEQGPGDLLTGKFGRIMWFPPYDLSFNESSSVNLESNLFIGRGEPLYTYNNTERTGSLSFKVIVDHPSIMNAFQGDSNVTDEFIDSWISGCVDLDNSKWSHLLTTDEKSFTDTRNAVKANTSNITPIDIQPKTFKIYFKNDCTDVDENYEKPSSGSASLTPTYTSNIPITFKPDAKGVCQPIKPETRTWTDKISYGLNSSEIMIGNDIISDGWTSPDFFSRLNEYLISDNLKDYIINIKVGGFASSQGCYNQNIILATGRRDNTIKYLKDKLNGIQNISITPQPVDAQSIGQFSSGGYTNNPSITPQDGLNPKADRYALISFSVDYSKTKTSQVSEVSDSNTVRNINQQIKKRFYTESSFFEKLKREDPFIFDKISQKIRYFHPAFHSMTPEGFNSRLTFLLQCTRQGPTINGTQANNLAFGPPPVCILRVGDFYNTKIMIDNMTFDFQEPQWDLNPEGVGVQPMIANVTMSFKYIGGSSLQSPINKLQNALSFNFFANTQVYDPRADFVARAADINASKGTNNFADKKNTFGTNDNKLENNYVLVLGMNPSTDPYETSPSIVPTNTIGDIKNIDQTKAANNANNGPAPKLTGGSQDAGVLYLPNSEIYFTTAAGLTALTFNIVKNVVNDLSQSYTIGVQVQELINPAVTYNIADDGTNNMFPSRHNSLQLMALDRFSPKIPNSLITDPYNYLLIVTLTGETDKTVIKLKGNINKVVK